MKIRRAALGFIAVTAVYLGLLIWADSRNQVLSALPVLLSTLVALAGFAFVTFLLRYVRWRWLMRRAGHPLPVVAGFLGYIAGFAFTATPGKVGELVRVRYFGPMGVPPQRVIGGFVFERAFDLISTLMLAAVAAAQSSLLPAVAGFVGIVLGAVVLVARHPEWLGRIAGWIRARGWHRPAHLLQVLGDGVAATRIWANPLDCLIALALGLASWGLMACSFVWLLPQLGAELPTLLALSIYPAAMLAGAASMLPGGLGSTEAVIVALLVAAAVPVATATLAAVGIRLATLWFSIALGLGAMVVLEWRARSAAPEAVGL